MNPERERARLVSLERLALVDEGVDSDFLELVQLAAAVCGTPVAAVGFLGRLPIALMLGWVFVRRRTIWAPYALHAVFNGVLIVLAEVALSAAAA